jgi:hypothetical protein
MEKNSTSDRIIARLMAAGFIVQEVKASDKKTVITIKKEKPNEGK